MSARAFICSPSAAVPGILVLQRHEGRLLVRQADRLIWVASELVRDLRAGLYQPHSRLDDNVLTVDGADRRVVYVLGEYLPGVDCWLATRDLSAE